MGLAAARGGDCLGAGVGVDRRALRRPPSTATSRFRRAALREAAACVGARHQPAPRCADRRTDRADRHRSRPDGAHSCRLCQDIDHRAIASRSGRRQRFDEPEADGRQPATSTNCATNLLAHLERIVAEEEAAEATASWSEADFERALRHWPLLCRHRTTRARPVPALRDPWTIWLMLGGRGAGKTRTGAEWVRGIALGEPDFAEPALRRIALVGENVCRCAQCDDRRAGRAFSPSTSGASGRHGRRRCASSNGRTARSRMCFRPKIRIPCAARNSRPPGPMNSPSGAMWRRPGTCCNSAFASARIRARW